MPELVMRTVPPLVFTGVWAAILWLNQFGTGCAPISLSAPSGPGTFPGFKDIQLLRIPACDP